MHQSFAILNTKLYLKKNVLPMSSFNDLNCNILQTPIQKNLGNKYYNGK